MKVLFTGISGVDLYGHATTLSELVRLQYDRKVVVLKAEEHFLRAIKSKPAFVPKSFSHLASSQQVISALQLPKPYLKDCWLKAVTDLLGETSTDQDVFLCAHTVFLHQQTREFFCILNSQLLKDWKPDIIITLIDDIEHCLDRLKMTGQMFSSDTYTYTGLQGVQNAIHNMRLLYDWRSIELLSAERLAADIEVPHFCMAVKHPIETFASLIYKTHQPVIYISHPISEPRRRLAAGSQKDFDQFTKELENVCMLLRNHMTLIEPTTIDEFRLRRHVKADGSRKKTLYLPIYEQRWPVTSRPLWKRPVTITDNPVDPGNHFDESVLAPNPSTDSLGDSKESADLNIATILLDVMVGAVTQQIDTRDHKLVEQCDGLVVLRPLYAGNASSGVEEEINYHCLLAIAEQKRSGGIWIYTHEEDEHAYLMRVWIPSYFRTLLASGEAELVNTTEPIDVLVRNAVEKLDVTHQTSRAIIVKKLMAELARSGVKLVGRDVEGALARRRESATAEAYGELVECFNEAKPPYVEILEENKKHDPTLEYHVLRGPTCSEKDFLTQVVECYKKVQSRYKKVS